MELELELRRLEAKARGMVAGGLPTVLGKAVALVAGMVPVAGAGAGPLPPPPPPPPPYAPPPVAGLLPLKRPASPLEAEGQVRSVSGAGVRPGAAAADAAKWKRITLCQVGLALPVGDVCNMAALPKNVCCCSHRLPSPAPAPPLRGYPPPTGVVAGPCSSRDERTYPPPTKSKPTGLRGGHMFELGCTWG